MTPFGTRRDGHIVHAINLSNATLKATILTHGAVLQDLRLVGVPHGLTLGSPDLAAYEGDMAYFGSIVAPVVNRIGGAQAVIAGQTHRFEANVAPNTLHSGASGSQNALWSVVDHDETTVTLALTQPDGEGGFPGNRSLTAIYALHGDTLSLTITATTDAETLMNVAHHGYWNLDGTPTWAGHSLQIHAQRYLPTTPACIPTGEVAKVAGTGFDFTIAKSMQPGEGPAIDHNFCLTDAQGPLRPAVALTGASGVRMEIATTEPGVQIFDGAPINTGTLPTLHGRPYAAHCGFAIEPQGWPDAPHNPGFPSIALSPGDTYRQQTTWRFSRS